MDMNWKEVWIKKGRQSKDLHQLDGWDHLTKKEHDIFLKSSLDPLFKFLENAKSVSEIGCGSGAVEIY